MIAELSELIRAAWDGWTGPRVEHAILGRCDADDVALEIDEWCGHFLRSPIARAHWYKASVGLVTAVRLQDGREVVVKVYQPRYRDEFVEEVMVLQRMLASCWYPCGRPLGPPGEFAGSNATAETVINDPGPSTDRDLLASAAGLARTVRYTDGWSDEYLVPHPLEAEAGKLWPEPHSPIFKFWLDREGAAWIEEYARVAKAAREADRSRPVVTHTDWSARNVRWDRRGLQAVFDLDSLAMVSDAVGAGQAAVVWAHTMDDGEPPLPAPDEIGRFIEVYQEFRGYRFRPAMVRAAWGSALWVLAYTARCEHALGRPGLATERLRASGDELASRASAG